MWTLLGLLATLVTASVATTVEQSNCILRSRDLCKPTHQEMKDAYTQFMIVPQVIQTPPTSLLTAYYNEYTMCIGNKIPPWETTIPAFISWPHANPTGLHTLVGIDLDYPRYFSSSSQYLLELIVNIRGSNFTSGTVLTPFKPVAPLPGSGHHRLAYFVFKQPHPAINVTDDLLIRYSKTFTGFYIADFIREYNLGVPVAGNFFVSRQICCTEEKNYNKCETCESNESKLKMKSSCEKETDY